MTAVIVWTLVGTYVFIGIKQFPKYYKDFYARIRAYWTYDTDRSCHIQAFWTALGLSIVWPFYDGGGYLINRTIHSMTREERREAEYQKAREIVEEYTERKEREAKEAFDRELKGE